MRFDLRHAGLSPDVAKRLRIAANALAAHDIKANASEWDGTRCDAVALNPDDAYGKRVLDLARKRATPIVEIRISASSPEQTLGVAQLTRMLLDAFKQHASKGNHPSPKPRLAVSENGTSPLVRMATDPSLIDRDIIARTGDVTIWLMRESGRISSRTVADQLRARTRFAETSDWTLTPFDSVSNNEPPGEISASLDAFLVSAAWLARTQLPPLVTEEFSLRDWPDLGAAATVVEALDVAKAVLNGAKTLPQIATATGLDATATGACLWAFKAAGLLTDRMPATNASRAPRRMAGGLFSRLAAHFGLARA